MTMRIRLGDLKKLIRENEVPIERTMAYHELKKAASWADHEWGSIALVNAIDTISGYGKPSGPDADPVEGESHQHMARAVQKLKTRGYTRGLDGALQKVRDYYRESIRKYMVGPGYEEALSYLRNP